MKIPLTNPARLYAMKVLTTSAGSKAQRRGSWPARKGQYPQSFVQILEINVLKRYVEVPSGSTTG